MSTTAISFKQIVVLAHPNLTDAARKAAEIASSLQQNNLSVSYGLLYDEELHRRIEDGEFDLLIALGGDGTMLRAGHLCGPIGVPILGINLGRFGFLIEITYNQWRDVLPRLLQGDYWLEKRMMLRANAWHAGKLIGTWDVLNEIVISRGHIVRPIRLATSVDGRYLTTYVADALIAATATGSTAYAMAAGGPILSPEMRNILLVAVAPHLSIDRAIVLADGCLVSITVQTDHHAVLSPDGQLPIDLNDGDRVDAYASDYSVSFVRFQDPGYFYRNLTPHMNQNPSTGKHR